MPKNPTIVTQTETLSRAADAIIGLPGAENLSKNSVLNAIARSILGDGRNWGAIKNLPSPVTDPCVEDPIGSVVPTDGKFRWVIEGWADVDDETLLSHTCHAMTLAEAVEDFREQLREKLGHDRDFKMTIETLYRTSAPIEHHSEYYIIKKLGPDYGHVTALDNNDRAPAIKP